MTTSHDPSPAPASRLPSRWAVLIPGLALLLGLVLGGVVVGVAQGGDSERDTPAADEGGAPTPDPSDEAGTAVVVPDSCLEVADSAQQATELIRNGIGSIRDFQADEIIDLLNNLEDLDAVIRDQAGSCKGTSVSDAPLDGATSSAPPEPAPTTSAAG